MTVLDQPIRGRRAAPPAATRPARVRLASDGVVAAYLHDISRHTAAPALSRSRSRSPRRRTPARLR
jgi:hypothetical protein